MDHREREKFYRELGHQQLFDGVSMDAVEYLFEQFTEQELAADQVVLERGQENRQLYLLLNGEVAVHLDGRERAPLYQLGAGECFGELALIDGGLASACVITQTPVRCMVISGDTLWAMVHRSHAIARNLLFILSRRVRSSNDTVSANLSKLEQWESFAFTDALTGLKNRRWLDESLPEIFDDARTTGSPLALMMLDVDHFKQFNDTWGHPAGDEALHQMALCLEEQARGEDHVARYGGEEFLVVLPNTDIDTAEQLADQLRATVADNVETRQAGKTLPGLTLSIGVTALDLNNDNDEPIERADRALYRAKDAGRNRIAIG